MDPANSTEIDFQDDDENTVFKKIAIGFCLLSTTLTWAVLAGLFLWLKTGLFT